MSDQFEADFERAVAYFEANDFASAEAACLELLADAPQDADLHHLLGAALLQKGSPADAISAFRQACELAPEQAEIFGHLAMAYDTVGEFELAADAYRQAIDLGESDPEMIYGLALATKMTAKPADAAALAEGLVADHPDHGAGWHLLAVSRMEAGAPEAAVNAFEKLFELEPDNDDAYGNYAVVLSKLDRRDEARLAFERAISSPDASAECLLNFGMMLEEQGEETEALTHYRHAAAKNQESALICETFAKLARRRGEDAQAITHLRDVTAGHPTLDFAWFYLAGAYLATGDRDAATEAMGRYLDFDPEDRLGGRLTLGAGGATELPEGPSEAYLRGFYRVRASGWDKTVTEAYHGHELVMAAFERYLEDCGRPEVVLDAGCGSGSLGAKLRPSAGRLDGIDISPEMVAEAQKKEIYDSLQTDDLFQFLDERAASYDLIVAAAVLFHFRDLDGVLRPIAGALRPNGQAIFTLFKSESGTLRLNDQGFFEHSREEIIAALASAGLRPVEIDEAIHEFNSDDEPRPCFCVRCSGGASS